MKRLSLVLVIVPALLLTGACAEQEVERPAVEPAEPAEIVETVPETTPETGEEADLPPVEIAAEGTELDPPVDPQRLPDGVWYCDMGTTHYARADKGDGKCPVCGMFLVEKGDEAGGGEG